MDIDEVKQFSSKMKEVANHVKTEQAVKNAMVMPFLQMLGYNVFDPTEVVPEFVASVPTHNAEKVDFAILRNGKPSILIEAKNIDEELQKHDPQLYKYFSVTEAKFAILTNGKTYKFFSDIDAPNKMDSMPFLEINLFNLKDATIDALKKFCKESFNPDDAFSFATILKYKNGIKSVIKSEMDTPSDDFVKMLVKNVYEKNITQAALDKFRPIAKDAIAQYLSDLFNDRLQAVINPPESEPKPTEKPDTTPDQELKKPTTTEEELEGYAIVKTLCKDVVDPRRITKKDTLSYFGILLDNNTWKWICRLVLTDAQKTLTIPNEDKDKPDIKFILKDVDDLYNYKNQIVAIVKRYLKKDSEVKP